MSYLSYKRDSITVSLVNNSDIHKSYLIIIQATLRGRRCQLGSGITGIFCIIRTYWNGNMSKSEHAKSNLKAKLHTPAFSKMCSCSDAVLNPFQQVATYRGGFALHIQPLHLVLDTMVLEEKTKKKTLLSIGILCQSIWCIRLQALGVQA